MDDATLSDIQPKNDVAKLLFRKKCIVSTLRENRRRLTGRRYQRHRLAMKASDRPAFVITADATRCWSPLTPSCWKKRPDGAGTGVTKDGKTFSCGNMIKRHSKMTTSLNSGNICFPYCRQYFPSFLPIAAVRLILLNLICLAGVNVALPWDNVDKTELMEPKKWEASSIGRFMLHIGPGRPHFRYPDVFADVCHLFQLSWAGLS